MKITTGFLGFLTMAKLFTRGIVKYDNGHLA